MPSVQITHDPSAFHFQGGKERCGAVPQVVVRAALSLSRTHGQQGLRTVQGLNLDLLVYTQNQGLIRHRHLLDAGTKIYLTY
jgi:hypothetical protein